MSFDLIIFDLDGTLVDSKVDIANSVRYTLKELGLRDIPPEVIYTFVGKGVEPLIRKSLAVAGDGNIDSALAVFRDHYEEHLLDNTLLYPSVYEVLNSLVSVDKVVLTNKITSFATKALRGLDVDNHFLDIFGGDSFPSKKPNPEGIRIILKRFGANPIKTIIVGDSGVDIEAGKSADIITCGVTYGYRSVEELLSAEPDYVLDSIDKLTDIIYP